ncbi:MAG: methyltransferase domain-containing protein [Chloroflexi bacterium AL-W]|nr:methyltransferase domain-containing protein [Chloroflexi bacterium AL-N1]NOK65417.1 methyltransferase domain-containing protein [Chloroflexi bacterium AL-N10]NOK72317.1 methyltransferase domain-containing protein [Chloroflexi bacterium AL-N5]NOK79596.1 methyltransferase domain-containing protein [Chloroflexi bacterium AL-W]NOK87512.1 methyltransferase domain-containing protein [Chloroflexi bacterium AL-N15]
MYYNALPYLQCLKCCAKLTIEEVVLAADQEIIAGQLVCRACQNIYPIRDGIADFLGFPQPKTPAQITNELPLTAWGYERLWRPFALTVISNKHFPYRQELPLIINPINPQEGGLYLDLACSNGLYARALTQAMGTANGHVIGIDHALPMLREARKRARQAQLRISYIRAEVQKLPIMSNASQGVVMGGSLNEIGDIETCVQEMRRTLVSHGRFAMMCLTQAISQHGKIVQSLLSTGGIVFYKLADLQALFERYGLHIQTYTQNGIVLLFHGNSTTIENDNR